MDIKLVAFDLDGTILKSDGGMSELTRRSIEKAAEKGVIIVPTTGRTVAEIPDDVLALKGLRYAVVANGASVMDLADDREIFSDPITLDVGAKIFAVLYDKDIPFMAYSEGVCFCDERYMGEIAGYYGALGKQYEKIIVNMRFVQNLPQYFKKSGRNIEKIFIHRAVGRTRTILEKELEEIPSVITSSSAPINMEINAATVNKGAALAQLCLGLGLAREHVMALGDGENDASMMAFAGFSVAMANSVPLIKDIASYITVSNDDEGVTAALRKFIGIR